MKSFFIALIICLSALGAHAQNNKSIGGIVKNSQNALLPGVTVNLYKVGDSIPIQAMPADEKGRFEFTHLTDGIFYFTVSGAGYKKFTSGNLSVSNQKPGIMIPAVVLLPARETNLQELVVKSRKPLLVQDIDKTIVNVDAMIGSTTSNTLEILEKTPGVTVSNGGDISLNGKNGVLVLIDGRPTYMSGPDLAAYLKSLPGGLLDKIELMDNPPSKYDAAGNAVINIRLKKNRAGGFTGNFSGGGSQGVYARHGETVNFNWNHKKINLFGNIGYSQEKNYTDDRYERRFYGADTLLKSTASLINNQLFSSNAIDLRLGMDYAISAKTSYGMLVNLNRNNRSGRLDYTSNSYNSLGQPDSVGVGNSLSDNQRNNWAVNGNFLHKFNEQGHELSADLNYLSYQSQGSQQLNNSVYFPGNNLQTGNAFLYNLPANIRIYALKADYVYPLKDKASLEAGIKAGWVKNDNDSKYFELNGNNEIPDYSKSNHFIYRENIYAAYINTRKSWKRFGTQLGLRVENTHSRGNQLGNTATGASSFSRQYTGAFPSLFLSYKLDSLGNHTLTTSFARRINRPNYQQLNPFVFFRDNYSYTSGDPLLQPQYMIRYELRYQYKQYFGTSIQYNRATNLIFQTTETKGELFITRPANIASGQLIIWSSNFSLNPARWWTINTNIWLAHMKLDSRLYGELFKPSANTYRININNQFNFSKGWSAELSGWYFGRDIQNQAIAEPRYRLFAALQKKILKDKGSIKFTIDDPFHLLIYKENAVSIYQSASYRINTSDTERIGISFTWRFGKDNSNKKRKQTDNAADAEKGRVD